MVIISFKKTTEIDLENFLRNTKSVVIQKNFDKRVISQLVKDYMHILENDVSVSKYCEQPFSITYQSRKVIKEFVPDYYVLYTDGSEKVVTLNQGLMDTREILEVKEIFRRNKIELHLLEITEGIINVIYNYKFLSNYHYSGQYINDLDIQLVFKTIDRLKRITIKNLLDEIGISFERKAEILYVTWYLLSAKLLNFNEQEKISLNTIIWG